jgi:hypothetical protein
MAWMIAVANQHLGSVTRLHQNRPHTLRRRVLAKVLGLVSAEKAGGLDLGGRAAGKLLVEVDDALHAKSVRGSTNGLHPWSANSSSQGYLSSPDSLSAKQSRPRGLRKDVEAAAALSTSGLLGGLIKAQLDRKDVPSEKRPRSHS